MEPSSQQSDQAREVGRALAKSRETEALSVLNLPNYRIAALSQVSKHHTAEAGKTIKTKARPPSTFERVNPRSPGRVTALEQVWPSTGLAVSWPAWRGAGGSQCPAWSGVRPSKPAQTSRTGTGSVSQHFQY